MVTIGFLGPYAGSIATAVAPVLSAVAVFLVNRALNRLDKVKQTAEEVKQENRQFADDLGTRLKEAEAVIRGDLKNGVKERLDTISTDVNTIKENTSESK